jgi:hypothetical protein
MRSDTASTLSRETGSPSVVLVRGDKNRTTVSILPGISWSRPTYLPPPAATIKAIHCSLSFERSASPAILGRGLGLSTLIQTSALLDLFLAADGGSCASEVRCDGWAKETLRGSAISCSSTQSCCGGVRVCWENVPKKENRAGGELPKLWQSLSVRVIFVAALRSAASHRRYDFGQR